MISPGDIYAGRPSCLRFPQSMGWLKRICSRRAPVTPPAQEASVPNGGSPSPVRPTAKAAEGELSSYYSESEEVEVEEEVEAREAAGKGESANRKEKKAAIDLEEGSEEEEKRADKRHYARHQLKEAPAEEERGRPRQKRQQARDGEWSAEEWQKWHQQQERSANTTSRCPICSRYVGGGKSGMDQHQRVSSHCRARAVYNRAYQRGQDMTWEAALEAAYRAEEKRASKNSQAAAAPAKPRTLERKKEKRDKKEKTEKHKKKDKKEKRRRPSPSPEARPPKRRGDEGDEGDGNGGDGGGSFPSFEELRRRGAKEVMLIRL